jgi:hypothetical protein
MSAARSACDLPLAESGAVAGTSDSGAVVSRDSSDDVRTVTCIVAMPTISSLLLRAVARTVVTPGARNFIPIRVLISGYPSNVSGGSTLTIVGSSAVLSNWYGDTARAVHVAVSMI